MSIAEIGKRIRAARRGANLKVKELAEHVTREPQTVYRWEWGQSEPTLRELEQIAEKCGVSLAWLVAGTHDEPSFAGGAR
jgi:transcriptional regulator with XRE-family HTH domain